MTRYWGVKVIDDNRVVVEPPQKVCTEYQDCLLEITGTMPEADKLEIAQKIVSVLNASFDT